MVDVAKEKYQHLMTEIQELEDAIEGLEKKKDKTEDIKAQIVKLQEELAHKRNELARISDGCGTPHSL